MTNIVRPSSNWLLLVKTGPSAVLTNDQLVYTLQATNLGSAALLDVTVIDVLPAGCHVRKYIARTEPDDAAHAALVAG